MTETTPEQKYYRARRREIYLRWLSFIAVGVIIFLSIRGCQNEKSASIAYKAIKDTLQQEIAKRSMIEHVAAANKAEAEDMALRHSEILAEKDLLQQEVFDLTGESDRVNRLLKKAKEDKDTVKVFSFIDTLSSQNNLLNLRVRELVSVQKKSDSLYKKRIDSAASLANHWEKSYKGCIDAAEFVANELPKIKPKGKLYIDIAGIFGPVVGAGGGLSFVDKKGTIYSVDVLGTNSGVLYQGKVSRLLSLKRK